MIAGPFRAAVSMLGPSISRISSSGAMAAIGPSHRTRTPMALTIRKGVSKTAGLRSCCAATDGALRMRYFGRRSLIKFRAIGYRRSRFRGDQVRPMPSALDVDAHAAKRTSGNRR